MSWKVKRFTPVAFAATCNIGETEKPGKCLATRWPADINDWPIL